MFFATTLQKEFAENANKSYHAYKVIVVLHIYNKILGIGLAGHPTNKKKFGPFQILSSIVLFLSKSPFVTRFARKAFKEQNEAP